MDHKKLGAGIIVIALILLGLMLFMRQQFIDYQISQKASCPEIEAGLQCPHEEINKLTIPTYIIIAFIFLVVGVGIYLAFIEKGSEALVKSLKAEEKVDIAMSVLSDDEQHVVRAIMEQDGVSQSTLKYRVDMSKTKLSLLLKDLEARGIVSRVSEGKINRVYVKKGFFASSQESKQ